EAGRNVDVRVPIGRTGLQRADGGAGVLRQASCDNRPCSPGPHDHVIEARRRSWFLILRHVEARPFAYRKAGSTVLLMEAAGNKRIAFVNRALGFRNSSPRSDIRVSRSRISAAQCGLWLVRHG